MKQEPVTTAAIATTTTTTDSTTACDNNKGSSSVTTTANATSNDGTATTTSTSTVHSAAIVGLKRKADATDELEPERDGGISSSSSASGSGSETENAQDCKRIRFDESIFEEDERERLIREFVDRSTDGTEEIGKNCDKLQHEIAALSDLARAKELEWNSIMRWVFVSCSDGHD